MDSDSPAFGGPDGADPSDGPGREAGPSAGPNEAGAPADPRPPEGRTFGGDAAEGTPRPGDSGQILPPFGDSAGVPNRGASETGDHEPLGQPGMRHWRQSVITDPSLKHRGGIFFAAVEMTRMPMVLTDPNRADNPIVFANNAFYDLTGYEEDEVVGRNCRFLQGPGTDREAVAHMRTAIQRREAVAVEVLNYRRNGSPFWNAVFMGPVFDPDGGLLYYFGSQLDVSRRRESEQALRQSQKMEAIGQLTAGLAHDFNNLLQVITSSLERMPGARYDEAAHQRYVSAAGAAADRGVKLTRQLLAFARRSRLEPREVELSSLVAGIGELLDTTVGARAVLQLNLRRRLPPICVDPVHLEMALLNVLINARDATPQGGTITVETRTVHLNGDAEAHHLPPGDYVALSVIDEGAGMSPAVVARAIEPFFTTKKAGEGTGLGLAMAHGFAQQSRGRLEIESAEGRGTTVRFYFPVHAARALESPRAEAPAPAPASGPERPVVLVVDDNVEVAALAAETLREAGFEPILAHSGEEALAAFEAAGGRIDLLFSDVVMPGGMNGIVLAGELRARAPELPVLLTTGYNDEMLMEKPRPEGTAVIGKPYRQRELVERARMALERPRAGEARPRSEFGVART